MPAQPGNQVIAFPNRLKANATCQPEMGDDAASPHSQLNDFRSAMDTLEIGVAGWNAEGKLTLANTCFADLFGLSREQAAPGLPLRDFTDLAAASGVLDHSDSALLYTSFVNAFSVGEATSFVEPLSNGTHLCFTFRPMDSGGWLTTYEDVTARDRAQERLHYAATHDALTSVANRALLNEKLSALTQRGIPCAVVCLDLDRFKTVNDAIGHAGGDKLLKAVAQRLAAGHRQGDVIARLGGDEFVVVLVSIQTEADAAPAAERLIKMVSEPYVHEGNSISIGTSVGIALSPHDGRDAATLLQRADKALNTAKQAGKGTFRFFDKELESRLREMDELERDLRMALPNGEIEMYYQPLVRCRTGRVAGFEALMRWRHPIHGMVSPARFIPVAEAGGMICALGDFAIQRACRDAATWPAHLKVAVNLSPAQLRVGDVVATTAAALAMSGLEPSRLELEVTETVLIDDIEATRGILRALKDFGVRISMDDFGTGYSSLSYIQQMPFDKIKIDKSFVDGMGNGPGPDAVVQAVIDIAEKLGIETVAEGVETCDQYETLAARGCDLVQGFLFSKPMPEQRVRRIVEVIDGCMASRNRPLTMTGQPGTIKPDMHDPV